MAGAMNLDYPSYSNQPYQSRPLHFPVPKQRQQYYDLPDQQRTVSGRTFTCDPCCKSFFSKGKYNQHVSEHVDCPFPECGMSAHIKIIDKHITNQHMLVNFEALQMDNEAWISERKKRFPTTERAEMRRLELQEKISRGERLGLEKNKKKGMKKDKADLSEPQKKRGPRKERKNVSREASKLNNNRLFQNNILEVDLFHSDEEDRFGVPAFKGTNKFFEEQGEISYFTNKNTDDDVKSETNNLDISDEEEWDATDKNCDDESTKVPQFTNALGSLMGAYTDSEDDENAYDNKTLQSNIKLDHGNKNLVSNTVSDEHSTETNQTVANNKLKSSTNVAFSNNGNTRHHKRRKGRGNADFKGKLKKTNCPLNVNRKRRRKTTLLERLLEPDIRHERNVILQCIRHIVHNNFFNETIPVELSDGPT